MTFCEPCRSSIIHDCELPFQLELCLSCALGKDWKECTESTCSTQRISPNIAKIPYRSLSTYASEWVYQDPQFSAFYKDLLFIINWQNITWVEALHFFNLRENVRCFSFNQRKYFTKVLFTIESKEQAYQLLKNFKSIRPFLYTSTKTFEVYTNHASCFFSLLKEHNPKLRVNFWLRLFHGATDIDGNSLLHYISGNFLLSFQERLLFVKILLNVPKAKHAF